MLPSYRITKVNIDEGNLKSINETPPKLDTPAQRSKIDSKKHAAI